METEGMICNGDMTDVEALKSRLLARKTTKYRFSWNLGMEQTRDLLTAAYQAEVEYRGRKFIGDEATAANIARMAAFLTGGGSRFGVMLCGTPGNGKTTMLYAFRNVLGWLSDIGRFGGELRISILDAREAASCAVDTDVFRKIRSLPMLAIEDMGREAAETVVYGNVLNPVTDILEYRYSERLFTFVTTNLTPQQIRGKYGDRIADRANEMFHVAVFRNGSYRGKEM